MGDFALIGVDLNHRHMTAVLVKMVIGYPLALPLELLLSYITRDKALVNSKTSGFTTSRRFIAYEGFF
jgi:hypothetical protein